MKRTGTPEQTFPLVSIARFINGRGFRITLIKHLLAEALQKERSVSTAGLSASEKVPQARLCSKTSIEKGLIPARNGMRSAVNARDGHA